MALVNLVGFEGLDANTTTATVTGALATLLCGSAVPVTQIPINTLLASNAGSPVLKTVALSSGISRNFLCTAITSSAAYTRLNMSTTYLTPIPKTGKWYLGMRMYWSNAMTTATITTANIRLGTGTAIALNLPASSGAGVYYVEFVVDWVALTITGYVNGVQVGQWTGSTYVSTTYTGMYIYFGPQSSITSGGSSAYSLGFCDHYFIVEEANEPNPISGRLGPILVKQLPIAAISNAGRFTPPSGQSVIDTLNGNNTGIGAGNTNTKYLTAAPTTIVATDPHGDIAEATFTAPNETAAIKAVQIQVVTHKLQAAAAGTTLQLKQGATSLPADKTIPGLMTAPTYKIYGYSKAFDGSDWTAAKVGQIKIDVGSYRP